MERSGCFCAKRPASPFFGRVRVFAFDDPGAVCDKATRCLCARVPCGNDSHRGRVVPKPMVETVYARRVRDVDRVFIVAPEYPAIARRDFVRTRRRLVTSTTSSAYMVGGWGRVVAGDVGLSADFFDLGNERF
jgi:hypothetical protein